MMESAKAIRPLGIIGAMDLEIELLEEAMDDASKAIVAGCKCTVGSVDGALCVVARSGVGMVNAAACTQALIDRLDVSCIINTGVAGSLSSEVSVGDIVVAGDAINWVMDVQNLGYAPGQTPGHLSAILPVDGELRNALLEAAKSEIGADSVHEGRVASGDRFVRDVAERARIAETFDATCCEMEGAAIAQVCQLNGVPCAIVRAISDNADGSDAGSYDEFEAKAASQCASIIRKLVARMRPGA